MYPDHLEVTVNGVPRLDRALEEVGLVGGHFCSVGGPESPNCHPGWRLQPWSASLETFGENRVVSEDPIWSPDGT
jgi:hypothetical protein